MEIWEGIEVEVGEEGKLFDLLVWFRQHFYRHLNLDFFRVQFEVISLNNIVN
jgi:hypothetical protein